MKYFSNLLLEYLIQIVIALSHLKEDSLIVSEFIDFFFMFIQRD
ncbi:hypothetical protein OENI_80021 [Oenococcus oeni]|nr:hypothetical protein OENI_80021 [Oenococcus oeni]